MQGSRRHANIKLSVLHRQNQTISFESLGNGHASLTAVQLDHAFP